MTGRHGRIASVRLLGVLVGMAVCLTVTAATASGDAPLAIASGVATRAVPRSTATPVAAVSVSPVAATPSVTTTTMPRASEPATAGDACPAPDELVGLLQARYDETQAFRADFEQETYVIALGERDQARGTVAFAKPGRMRWDFQTPTEQLIVSDGSTLWIYQPAEQQVLRAPFRTAFVSTTPVSFLVGFGRITDDFRPQQASRACSATRAYVRLEPKDTQGLGGLELSVDRTTFDIVEASVTDPLGNVTTLRFADLQRNVEIPDREFEFVVPDGVDVIVAPGSAPPL